ncbi:hypothetical protein [Foetidibacter luteolus]|uniref:hypothetical protein n=1 Tax=Foetidibacter luteolus TaxID=2608880 RepID=UPI00129BD6E5|nr:hypothetical protein [Foetidibacter luteolus]
METKALINLKESTVELVGSEEFVSKYLDIFKDKLDSKKGPAKKEMVNDDEDGETEAKQDEGKGKEKKEKKASKPTKAKNIAIEKFDIHKDKDNPSLEDFLKEKNPGKTTANVIAVIGYYVTVLKGAEYFSEGNIDYAYRTLSIPKRPNHLRQIIINAKNDKDFFEPGEEGKWKLARTGEIFVDEKLPPKS